MKIPANNLMHKIAKAIDQYVNDLKEEIHQEDFAKVMATIDKLEDSLKNRLTEIMEHLAEVNLQFAQIRSELELHNMRIERLEKQIEGKQNE